MAMFRLPSLAAARSGPAIQQVIAGGAYRVAVPGDRAGYSQLALKTEGVRAGPPGRHAISGVRATVFGGAGFLGRYVVNQLAKIGSQVIVPYRCSDDHVQHLKVMGDLGQMVLVHDHRLLRNKDLVAKLCANSNVVVNLIGRDNETANFKYEELNIEVAEMIAQAAAAGGAERFLHVSAMGASPDATSKNLRTKYEGEQVVKAAFPGSTIFRPAPLMGQEDRLSNLLATAMKKLPFLPLVDGGGARFQPAYVTDVALAMIASLRDAETAGKTFELAGPEEFTLDSFSSIIQKVMREDGARVPIPASLIKVGAAPQEYILSRGVPVPSFALTKFTSEYADLWSVDNLPTPDALGFEDLGIIPRKVTEGLPIEHVRSYRVGGYDHGTTQAEL
eukprot:CAMPEP_0182894938 /NCGR_PEP_ID=MMETSP0034_2-20130328/25373_1 /TAXON_ID=156128 /ORGANISM="Nephroselmis pyriformis, Strain CCMP717" /LENGTH=389 /DNA_ID=CAMNT_0025028743 /DNA_START=57 /DNA_END=1226 /DNA_ORIENTATION=-